MTAVANRNLIIYLCGQGLSNVGAFSQQVAVALLLLRTDALYPRERRRGQQGRLIVAIR